MLAYLKKIWGLYLKGMHENYYPFFRDRKREEEFCPVCGYYCLGKGGIGCIDKPTMVNNPYIRES